MIFNNQLQPQALCIYGKSTLSERFVHYSLTNFNDVT